MIRWFFSRQLNAFERTWNYDAGYAREVLEVDPMALIAFMMVSGVLGNRKGAPPAARFAVSLVAVMAEDCGPCSQLGVDMAIAAGIDPKVICAVAQRDYAAMPEDMVLAVRFAEASLAHSPAADEPREEIVRRWGRKGLVSLAMAMTAARMYPTAKYALGHGQACMRLTFAGETATVSPKLRAAA
ncbi:MAG TPA: hypothetical protein VGG68_12960 [Caulobacteraceae bacterium]|jgi:uncharacterized lipoprotein YbaY